MSLTIKESTYRKRIKKKSIPKSKTHIHKNQLPAPRPSQTVSSYLLASLVVYSDHIMKHIFRFDGDQCDMRCHIDRSGYQSLAKLAMVTKNIQKDSRRSAKVNRNVNMSLILNISKFGITHKWHQHGL